MVTTGIILAGGRSSRMGAEKAIIELRGETLTGRAIKTLEPLCDNILISTNKPHLFSSLNITTVPDFTTDPGPLGGIASALERSQTDVNIVIAVDMPGITTPFLSHLLESYQGHKGIVPVSDTGLLQPLCGVYSAALLPAIKELLNSNRRAAAALTDLPGVLKVQVTTATPGYSKTMFENLNTPGDMERWKLANRH